jgi:integrase
MQELRAKAIENTKDIRSLQSIAAAALEFQILTAVRPGEARGATWNEIDFDNRVWTIFSGRMKVKDKDHRVPLSDAAIAVLRRMEEIKTDSKYLFHGRNFAIVYEESLDACLRGLVRSGEKIDDRAIVEITRRCANLGAPRSLFRIHLARNC